jgi:hypothetical protein
VRSSCPARPTPAPFSILTCPSRRVLQVRPPAFVHSPLLPPSAAGAVYAGLLHETDWFATFRWRWCSGVVLFRVALRGSNAVWFAACRGWPGCLF